MMRMMMETGSSGRSIGPASQLSDLRTISSSQKDGCAFWGGGIYLGATWVVFSVIQTFRMSKFSATSEERRNFGRSRCIERRAMGVNLLTRRQAFSPFTCVAPLTQGARAKRRRSIGERAARVATGSLHRRPDLLLVADLLITVEWPVGYCVATAHPRT